MKSIKAKLLLLGAVSIICTIILGITDIYIMNTSSSNSQVLNDINTINMKQSINLNEETAFSYDLDFGHYDTIAENLNIMKNTAKDALSYSGMKDYKCSPESISYDIDKALILPMVIMSPWTL